MFRRILVPIDFTPAGAAALALARSHFPEAERRLVHVLDPKRIASDLTSSISAREERERMESRELLRLLEVARAGETCNVRIGTAAKKILLEADAWAADLIVMGTHGRTGLAHFLNGSVAESVVRLAKHPVLIEHERGR
jgi:nucleotide-binding universal stress UspA family protein